MRSSWPFVASDGLNVIWNDQIWTRWGQVVHIFINKLIIIGSDNGLSPNPGHAIIRTNAGILLMGPMEINFSEIVIKVYMLSFKVMDFKMLSENWQLFCRGLNVLNKMYTIFLVSNVHVYGKALFATRAFKRAVKTKF